ncbi:hypothetical protein [Singulisphaera acidiphila]|uniref:Carboxypeptidase regulatory-like domain-containing protein n=1 Tax=Singulisphaera acidiphila (strain ATCC BAA-1392 / DSM 18658 / VKM B-2454 / MOB10) TaxID=886293 RepID=L0DDH6_SINAD|nr:hypothetical protein [Singulisphaera acidiphila]AGA27419.1 hypothetical protein Sinac_3146 [Singulisphaera acidiphila DSM 18658]
MRVCINRIALAACLACAGCRESWQANTYPATGRISINGRPPAGALVELFPTTKTDERNSRPWGLVKDDGTFVLATYDGEPGVPVGDYMLTIKWPPDASKPSMVDRLKSRYSSPEKSPWKVTIKGEDNVLPPVELTDVDVDMKADSAIPAGPMNTAEPKKSPKARR